MATVMKCGICGVFADADQMIRKSAGGPYLAIVCKAHSDATQHLASLSKLLADERHYRAADSWHYSDQRSQDREIEKMRISAGPGAKPSSAQPTPVGRFDERFRRDFAASAAALARR